jgi:hypothetical protein
MWESFLSNWRIEKFSVFSRVRVLTNSEFTTAWYCTLAQAKWIPSNCRYVFIRIYVSYLLWAHLLLDLWSCPQPSNFRRNKLTYYSSVLCVLHDRPICAVRATWQAIDFVSDIIGFITYNFSLLDAPPGLTLNSCAFSPHSVFICFFRISEQRANISLHHNLIRVYNRKEMRLLLGTNCIFNCNSGR